MEGASGGPTVWHLVGSAQEGGMRAQSCPSTQPCSHLGGRNPDARPGPRSCSRVQEGYDHSYYFISTFMDDHIAHHAKALVAK